MSDTCKGLELGDAMGHPIRLHGTIDSRGGGGERWPQKVGQNARKRTFHWL